MVTLVMVELPVALSRNWPTAEVVVRETVWELLAVATLLNESSKLDGDGARGHARGQHLRATVVNTNWLAAAAVTVSVCVAVGLARAVSVAERMGLPARVSYYFKLALVSQLSMVTLVMAELPVALSRNWPTAEVVVKVTVWELEAVAALLNASSSCTVIVPEVTPAVSVCTVVVKASLVAAAAFTVSVCVDVGVGQRAVGDRRGQGCQRACRSI